MSVKPFLKKQKVWFGVCYCQGGNGRLLELYQGYTRCTLPEADCDTEKEKRCENLAKISRNNKIQEKI